MKCDCCAKKKRMLESYEEIRFDNKKLHFCVKCNTDLYNMKDLYKANKTDEYEERKKVIDKKKEKCSEDFNAWYDSFLENITK